MEQTIVVLKTLKEALAKNITELQDNYPEFLPTLYVGVTMGYQTAIDYIDQALEVLDEKN